MPHCAHWVLTYYVRESIFLPDAQNMTLTEHKTRAQMINHQIEQARGLLSTEQVEPEQIFSQLDEKHVRLSL